MLLLLEGKRYASQKSILLEVNIFVRFSSTFLSHSHEKKMSQQIEEEETTDISQHQVRVAVRVRPLLDPSTEKSVAETFPSKIKVTHERRSGRTFQREAREFKSCPSNTHEQNGITHHCTLEYYETLTRASRSNTGRRSQKCSLQKPHRTNSSNPSSLLWWILC